MCLGLFLGLSALAVAAQTMIRIKTRHELYADDAFLFFGLTCMCVATGIAYTVLSAAYLSEATIFGPGNYTLTPQELPKYLKDVGNMNIFIVFAWAAEFSVKMSLLFFFRQLVRRAQRLTTYVHVIMGITTVVWAVCVCEPFMTCPHFGLSILSEIPRDPLVAIRLIKRDCTAKCTPLNVPLQVGITVLIVVLDICTDIMSMVPLYP